MNAAEALVAGLRDPASTGALDARGWTAMLAAARAELLLGTLAHRLGIRGIGGQFRAVHCHSYAPTPREDPVAVSQLHWLGGFQ